MDPVLLVLDGQASPPELLSSPQRLRREIAKEGGHLIELVAATPELTSAALAGPRELSAGLGAAVPSTWPPMFLDPPALEYTLERLAQGPDQADWWLYFVVLVTDEGCRTLVGSGGYKGPPAVDGTVEVGYGIVRDHQRCGYASDTVRALLNRALALPQVHRAIAETLPELGPSIGVLRKCGFRLIGEGSEPGVIRFELTRAEFTSACSR